MPGSIWRDLGIGDAALRRACARSSGKRRVGIIDADIDPIAHQQQAEHTRCALERRVRVARDRAVMTASSAPGMSCFSRAGVSQ